MKTLFTMGECMEQLCVSQRTVQRYLENEELDKIIVKNKKWKKALYHCRKCSKIYQKKKSGGKKQ